MFGITTTRRLNAALARQQSGFQAAMRQAAKDDSGARQILAAELSAAKDVIASHIVFVGHPSTVLQSPQACMESLRRSLADAGVDLHAELARHDGSAL